MRFSFDVLSSSASVPFRCQTPRKARPHGGRFRRSRRSSVIEVKIGRARGEQRHAHPALERPGIRVVRHNLVHERLQRGIDKREVGARPMCVLREAGIRHDDADWQIAHGRRVRERDPLAIAVLRQHPDAAVSVRLEPDSATAARERGDQR